MRQDPDYIVAERIIERIRKENLIPDDHLDSFRRKLQSGQLNREDWSALAELSLPKDNQDE